MQNYINTLLPLLIPFICIVLISSFYAIRFKRKITETFFLSIVTIIIVLFISGLLNFKGSLLLGYGVLIAFSIFSFVFLIKSHKKDKNIFKDIWLLQGSFIFLGFLFISLFINYGRMFIHWDEFSHWGSIVKNMYFLNALGTFKETSGHVVRTYLEGSSLFQYFWMKPFPQYTEFPAYIASNMLYFSIICSLIKKYDFKNVLFIATSLLIPLLAEASFYSSLYVDTIVGLLLGASYIYYHYYKYEKSLFGILIVLASVTLLSLTKDIGFAYSLVAIAIFTIDTLIYKRDIIRDYFKNLTLLNRLKRFLLFVSPLISTILIQIIWKINIKLTHIDTGETVVSKGLSLIKQNISNLLNGNLEAYQLQVIELYKDALITRRISFLVVVLGAIVLTILFGFLMRKQNIKPNRLIINILLLILGSLSIVFVLLIAYLFVFSQYEALSLMSYGRYILSYLVAIFFSFQLFIILKPSKKINKSIEKSVFLKNTVEIIKYFSIFVVFFALLYKTKNPIISEILFARNSVNSTIESRKFYDQILTWDPLIPEEKEGRTYVIAQKDKGFSKLVIIYNLLPTGMKWITDYSVSTEPYYPEYPWTKIITPDDWGRYVLDNYDLVYILNHDQKFVDLYGQFFDKVNSNSLYRVTTNENGILQLITIERK